MPESKPHFHGHRQRLRDRLARDPRSLADYELLELLLGHVLTRRDTKPLAKALIDRFGSLRGAFEATEAELTSLDGFGPGLTAFWALWRETWSRLHESELPTRSVLGDSAEVARLARTRFGANRREEFWLALVDNRNRLLSWERLGIGTVDHAAVYPREVLALALKHQAAGMILVHNHPGGDPRPSPQDVELTRRISRTGLELGLRVLDHIIVCADGYYSFQDSGML